MYKLAPAENNDVESIDNITNSISGLKKERKKLDFRKKRVRLHNND